MEFYAENQYKALFYSGSDPTSRAAKIIQESIERNLPREFYSKVLEIGGGEGFHVENVKHGYDEYHLTDIELRDLTDYASALKDRGQLYYYAVDAHSLQFENSSFDRIIFMCVLHHIARVEEALKEARRVVNNEGLVSIYLPCDPGAFYRFIRSIFISRKVKRLKINYKYLNALDHIGHFSAIDTLIRHVFAQDSIRIRKFPFPKLGWNFNIYNVYQITIKKS